MLFDIHFLPKGKHIIYKIYNIYTINQGKYKSKNYDTFLQAFIFQIVIYILPY